nr:unnamed protein product [Spirometra erinaceieuropaei]
MLLYKKLYNSYVQKLRRITSFYDLQTAKCQLINCLETNVCTFIRSKWYSLYSVERTKVRPHRNISQPNPAWTDYSKKGTLQRGLSISVLICSGHKGKTSRKVPDYLQRRWK